MAQVMYDRAIRFAGQVYSVTQTWNGPTVVVQVTPPNDDLKALVEDLVLRRDSITLRWREGYFEIDCPPNRAAV